MAKALLHQSITPADELRNLLAQSEKLVARPSSDSALELLRSLDRISALWPELEASGVDLRPESGRWESLQAAVHKNGPSILRALATRGGLATVRAASHPDGTDGWWWHLDREVRAARVRLLSRVAIICGAVVAVVALVGLVMRLLFPVDPRYQAAVSRLLDGQAKIQSRGDYLGALGDFKEAVALKPDDAEAWLWLGTVQRQVGDDEAAEESFRQARDLYADDLEFRLNRAAVFLAYGLLDEALGDLEVALALDPENPQAYLYLAGVFDAQERYAEAVWALERVEEYAEKRGQLQISAQARFQLALLLQRMPIRPPATPAPTPP